MAAPLGPAPAHRRTVWRPRRHAGHAWPQARVERSRRSAQGHARAQPLDRRPLQRSLLRVLRRLRNTCRPSRQGRSRQADGRDHRFRVVRAQHDPRGDARRGRTAPARVFGTRHRRRQGHVVGRLQSADELERLPAGHGPGPDPAAITRAGDLARLRSCAASARRGTSGTARGLPVPVRAPLRPHLDLGSFVSACLR